jgi:3-deoxy-D-manno-octulosonic acid (KDO) 8-phosphate synthase
MHGETAKNNYFASFFFQTIHAGNAASGPLFTNDQYSKTIVRGTMDVGINNVIYIELHLGPKMANSTCGKTIVAETID